MARHIILATAEGCGTAEIMRRSGNRARGLAMAGAFMAEGVDGLTRDKTRSPAATASRHRRAAGGRSDARPATGRCNPLDRSDAGEAAGVSLRSVQRILEAHRLAPHRVRTFKLSTDPKFAAKLKDMLVSTSIRRPCGRSVGR